MYPFFWDYEDHEEAIVDGETLLGCTAQASTNHLFEIAPEFKKDKRPNILCTAGFTATYNPYNLLRIYLIGGSIHFLNYGDNIPEQIQTVVYHILMLLRKLLTNVQMTLIGVESIIGNVRVAILQK